jgi:hypothetical protein
MENNHQFPDGFESWIRNKSWSELNAEELKQLQDEQINEDEFLQLKQMLIQLELIEEEPIQPKDELKNALLEAFEKGPGKPGRVISMPVWIATFAVAAAVLVFFVWFMPKEASKNTVADIPQISQTENSQVQNDATSSSSQAEKTIELKTNEVISTENEKSSNSLVSPIVEEVKNDKYAPIVASEDVVSYNENVSDDDLSNSPSSMNNLNKEVIVESKAATTTTSMAQNFSTNSTSISSQLFSSGSTAQNFDQSLQLTPNMTLAANKNMLDVLVTVY